MFDTLVRDDPKIAAATRSHPTRGGRVLRELSVLLFVGLAALTWAVAPASSQSESSPAGSEAEPEAANDDAFKGVEEMMVEARRRSESLQKIGESVTSFSSSDLFERGLVNFNDLQYNVPSLFSGGGLTKITLRGVGSEIVGPGIDPGFAVHVNGVFSARETTGLIIYFDIERVDVLRGPQGTLWGRNSTGGAVNIVTKKAEHSFSVSANAEYEWFDSGANGLLIRGVLNIPLVEDKLALRVAFLTNFDDGQMEIRSERNRQQLSKADLGTLRASLRWEPRDNVTVDLIGGWLRTDGSGAGVKFQGNYPTPPPPNSAGSGAGVDFTGALRNPKDPYRGTADEPQRSDATVYTATLLVAWQAENFKFDSITGYQSTDFFLHRDQDTSSLPISVLELTDKSRQISQEFLVNSTWDKPVNYTIGAIYQYDWTPQTLIDVFYDQDTTLATPILLLPGLPILPGAGLPEGLSLVDNCPIPTSFFVFDPSCPPSNWPETPTRTSFTPWPKSRTTSSGSTPISAGRSSTI